MKRCDEDQADILIDGAPFRLESLPEFRQGQGLTGLKGLAFPDMRKTKRRLAAERRAELRALSSEKGFEQWFMRQVEREFSEWWQREMASQPTQGET